MKLPIYRETGSSVRTVDSNILGAKEMRSGDPRTDKHGTPAIIFISALRACLSIVNGMAVLADKDRALYGDRPPHPWSLRMSDGRFGIKLGIVFSGLVCPRRDYLTKDRRGVFIGCLREFFGRGRREDRHGRTI